MKWIRYTGSIGKQNVGTEENPVWEDILNPMAMSYCKENEERAKMEAYNGEYTIEDDGIEEVTTPTTEERVEALEAAVTMLCMPDVSEV